MIFLVSPSHPAFRTHEQTIDRSIDRRMEQYNSISGDEAVTVVIALSLYICCSMTISPFSLAVLSTQNRDESLNEELHVQNE